MTANVNVAVYASCAGIPVVITSGFAIDNIIKVLQGERKGTLFHKDAHLWTLVKEVSAREMVVAARESSRQLQALKFEDRRNILLDVAENMIMAKSYVDIKATEDVGYEKSLISRLALKLGKVM